jgi:hypothetical protein
MAEESTIQCSPVLKRRPGETCIPPKSLHAIQRVWNRLHPEDVIRGPVRRGTRKAGMGGESLWKRLRSRMAKHYKCSTEFCMVEKMPGLSKDERQNLKGFFRPEMPDVWKKKPTTWLDSFNIEDVMEQ